MTACIAKHLDWRSSAQRWVSSVAWGKRVVAELTSLGMLRSKSTNLVASVLAEQEGLVDPYCGLQAVLRLVASSADDLAVVRRKSLDPKDRREVKTWLLETVEAVLTAGGIVGQRERNEIVHTLGVSFEAGYQHHRVREAVAVVQLYTAVAQADTLRQRTKIGRRGSRPDLSRFVVEVVNQVKSVPIGRLPRWTIRSTRAKYRPSPFRIVATYLERLEVEMLKKPADKRAKLWTPSGLYTEKAIAQFYRQWSSNLSRLSSPTFP